MKDRRIVKAITLTTALGVFLTGCGGGPDSSSSGTSSASKTTTTAPTTSSSGAASPTTSSGSGTIGFTANETIDQVAANQSTTNAKLDKLSAGIDQANKTAKSNSSLLPWILGIGAGVGALVLANRVSTGIKVGKEDGLFHGLGAAVTGNDVRANEINTQKAAAHIEGNDNSNAGRLSGQVADGDAALAKGIHDTQGIAAGAVFHAQTAARFGAEGVVETKKVGGQVQTVGGQVSEGNEAAKKRADVAVKTSNEIKDKLDATNKLLSEVVQKQIDALTARMKSAEDLGATKASQKDVDALKSELKSIQEQVEQVKKNSDSKANTQAFDTAVSNLSQRIQTLEKLASNPGSTTPVSPNVPAPAPAPAPKENPDPSKDLITPTP